eukprot:COSAG01_NODE_36672_length_514_cov_0.742169_1_plen_94_part_10
MFVFHLSPVHHRISDTGALGGPLPSCRLRRPTHVAALALPPRPAAGEVPVVCRETTIGDFQPGQSSHGNNDVRTLVGIAKYRRFSARPEGSHCD